MELDTIYFIIFVFDCHDLIIIGSGDNGKNIREVFFGSGKGMISGNLDPFLKSLEQFAVDVDICNGHFAMHQLFGVCDRCTVGFTDCLMSETDTKDRNLAGKIIGLLSVITRKCQMKSAVWKPHFRKKLQIK